MNDTQITMLLVATLCFLLILYVLRRRAAVRHAKEQEAPSGSETVSYATGRDETQWRRAYSRS